MGFFIAVSVFLILKKNLMKLLKASVICIFMLSNSLTFGATRTAIANGNWANNSTWDCGCIPSDSDHIIIPTGRIVRITSAVLLVNIFSNIVIEVWGELILDNASLSVNAADVIMIPTGGKITDTGFFGGLITSGLGAINSFPINGPASITNGVLPIELVSFTVEETSGGILVKWESAMERDVSHYVVERSADGISFEELHVLSVAGNSMTSKSYTFMDTEPFLGRAYYRLRSVDLDGSIEIFNVVSAMAMHAKFRVTMYPNPVAGSILRIAPNAAFKDGDHFVILSSHGKSLLKGTITGFLNELDLAGLESGVYYIELRTHLGNFTERLIKQ
jgi:hypothetical protein